jgi:hypothetical protein
MPPRVALDELALRVLVAAAVPQQTSETVLLGGGSGSGKVWARGEGASLAGGGCRRARRAARLGDGPVLG